MALRVLIAPDKFKGTLSALDAAHAMAEGWRSVRPLDVLELVPMSDGGDGFGEVLSTLLKADRYEIATVDAAHRDHHGAYWIHVPTETVILETAQIIGLALLPPGKYHPFELDTYGLGALFEEIQQTNPQRCIVGIGGSATNDGGFGLARALGWKFRNASRPIEHWTELDQLTEIIPPSSPIELRSLTIAMDVRNPLLGPEGASRIYGPQKGLRSEDFVKAEAALGRLAEVWRVQFGTDPASEPGAGAAGGLGFGLRAFLQGSFESGFTIFSQLARLGHRLKSVDLVLTGEGRIDESTSMGKGVGALAFEAAASGVPALGLGGQVQLPRGDNLFKRTFGIVPELATFEEAKRDPQACLRALAARAAREFSSPGTNLV